MLGKTQKEAWLSDLRSGKFKHGKGKLCVKGDGETKHCCLGVLCETLGVKMRGIIEDHGDGLPGESEKILNRIEVGSKVVGYEFFCEKLGIPNTELAKLYLLNDQPNVIGYLRQILWIEENVPTRVE